MSKEQASRTFGIKGHSTILKWMRKLEGTEANYLDMKKHDRQAYEARIRELERALKHEQMKSHAFEQMIRMAEEELKISIKKKLDTKQSKE